MISARIGDALGTGGCGAILHFLGGVVAREGFPGVTVKVEPEVRGAAMCAEARGNTVC